MARIITLFLFFLLLQSCKCDFDVNPQFISSDCPIEYAIRVSKIQVETKNEKGIPIVFSADTVLLCGFKGDSEALVKTGDYKAKKEIYFRKEDTAYEWFFFQPYHPSQKSSTLPIKFLPNAWYQVESLASSEEKMLFIFIDSSGEFTVHAVHNPGPF